MERIYDIRQRYTYKLPLALILRKRPLIDNAPPIEASVFVSLSLIGGAYYANTEVLSALM